MNDGQIVLDVHSAGEGIASLHGMFTSLQPSRPTGQPANRPTGQP